MDDFTIYGSSFDACLKSLDMILERCIETDLVLNYENFHFMVELGIVLMAYNLYKRNFSRSF